MNGISIVCDTNIIIQLLNGSKSISKALYNKQLFVSVFSEIELRSKPGLTTTELKTILSLINDCYVIPFDDRVKESAILLRKAYKLKLPDALILAGAMTVDLPLVTSDKVFEKVKDFPIVMMV
jgi:predicted nucleic acid-binding protein